MSKRVSDNAISLQEFAREANGEASEKARDLIELYKKRHIMRETTVRRLIGEMVNGTERKQKLGLKHAKAAITKYDAKVPKVRGAEKPITRRLRAKTNMREEQQVEQPITRRMKKQKQVLGEKIFKLFRNRLRFRITEEKAFKSGAVSVILEPISVGAVPASDLDVWAARSYLIAIKRIPKDAHFELYASCSLKINKTDRMIHITSEKFNSKNLSKFFEN